MLLGLGEPGIEIGAGGLGAGPILVLHLVRRVDHAGDVARAGQHETHRPAEELRAEQHRFCRRDVILAGGEIVDRDLHFLQVELLAADHHVALAEPVLQIAIAQVERVVRRRHARGIRVPVQQVEGRRLLALEIVVDDVGPDQVVRAQQIEGVGHLLAFEVAALVHLLLAGGDLLLVDEYQRSPAWVKSTCAAKKLPSDRRQVGSP